jgi:universal protein Kae1
VWRVLHSPSRNTFGIGVITEGGRILADERVIYAPPPGKGIIPHEARQHHERFASRVLCDALRKSKLKLENVDVIAYSAGPGLPPPLLFTANFASKLSQELGKPLVPVNHPVAHLEIAKLTTGATDPIFLYLSGGNTQVIAYVEGRYRVFGETLDIPCGNALDVVARAMGLPMPGGPEIERLAKKGKYVELPYVVKGMDVSFTGIATAAIRLYEKGVAREDIAYSMQETCFAMLTEVAERAMAHTGKEECLVTGGVAANQRLREMVATMCEERGANAYFVPPEYSGDNGVMIAWVGILTYRHCRPLPSIRDRILPKWRVDAVPICWTSKPIPLSRV